MSQDNIVSKQDKKSFSSVFNRFFLYFAIGILITELALQNPIQEQYFIFMGLAILFSAICAPLFTFYVAIPLEEFRIYILRKQDIVITEKEIKSNYTKILLEIIGTVIFFSAILFLYGLYHNSILGIIKLGLFIFFSFIMPLCLLFIFVMFFIIKRQRRHRLVEK